MENTVISREDPGFVRIPIETKQDAQKWAYAFMNAGFVAPELNIIDSDYAAKTFSDDMKMLNAVGAMWIDLVLPEKVGALWTVVLLAAAYRREMWDMKKDMLADEEALNTAYGITKSYDADAPLPSWKDFCAENSSMTSAYAVAAKNSELASRYMLLIYDGEAWLTGCNNLLFSKDRTEELLIGDISEQEIKDLAERLQKIVEQLA